LDVVVAAICGGTGLRNRVTKNPTSTPNTTTPPTRSQILERMLCLYLSMDGMAGRA
jgi:hypothetical protein